MKKSTYICTTITLILLMLFVTAGVISCTDTSSQNKEVGQLSSKLQDVVRSVESLFFKSRDEKINDIYRIYIYEKAVCQEFVKVLAEDQEFVKSYEKLGYRERNLSVMLSKRQIAQLAIVQYVLKHIDYFTVDVDFHGGPGMIYVENSNIYCEQTRKRLKELEALGPSEQSWQVREEDLNYSVDALLAYGMPGAEEGPIGYNFEILKAEFDFVKKFYLHEFKEPMKKWVQKTAKRLREKVDSTNEASDAKKQHTKDIDKWISQLNKSLD